jgi:hypothetical protein
MRKSTLKRSLAKKILTSLLICALALFLAATVLPWTGAAAPRKQAATAAPSGVSATRYGDEFMVTWSPVSNPAVAGYNVYRTYFNSSFFIRWGKLNQTPVSGTSYLDSTVAVWWLRQYYWVATVDAHGNILSLSGSAAIDPRVPDTSPPASPFNVEVSYVDSLSINWDFTNTEPDFAGFNVYAYPGGEGPAVKLNSTLLTVDFYYWEDGQLGDGVAVTSVDTAGNESASIPVAAVKAIEYITDFEQPPVPPFSAITFSENWARELYTDAHGGQLWVCDAAGDTVEVTFTLSSNGSKVELYSARYWQCGTCRVSLIDEATQAVITSVDVSLFYDNLDSYVPDWGFQVFKAAGLSLGEYTLKVENLGIPGMTAWPQEFLDYWELHEIPIPPFPAMINVDYLVLTKG